MELSSLLAILCFQLVQGNQQSKCNTVLEDKIISFENEYWPGYQLGIYHKTTRGGGLALQLESVSQTPNPGTLWMTEKCRDQICFSRYEYDQREMGDYYKDIGNEKNYFYTTRFSGLRVDHVWTSDLKEWKEKEPYEAENTFYGFDVFCDSCDSNSSGFHGCTVVTQKNKIGQWNADKVGKMMATSSGWVQLESHDKSEEWTIQTHDKSSIPIWHLGPNSGCKNKFSPVLGILIMLRNMF